MRSSVIPARRVGKGRVRPHLTEAEQRRLFRAGMVALEVLGALDGPRARSEASRQFAFALLPAGPTFRAQALRVAVRSGLEREKVRATWAAVDRLARRGAA